MVNFWTQLNKPFFCLAPMDDVTDIVFRDVVEKVSSPDVFFTEFVSVEGLSSKGRDRVIRRLDRNPESQKPLVAQIWGKDLDAYTKAAEDISKMGFSGIDINMGCPERGIVARGFCGGLIGNYDGVEKIIEATKRGANNLPISVKTRIGLNEVITEEWFSFLLEQNLDAITIHARTVREMSKVPARWDEFRKVVELRNKISPKTLIIGNGDILNFRQGIDIAEKTGVDGIMIGRGIFKDMFVFSNKEEEHTPKDMIDILLFHLDRYKRDDMKKPFNILKKFFKIYINGWDNASYLRAKLMETKSPEDVRKILNNIKDILY